MINDLNNQDRNVVKDLAAKFINENNEFLSLYIEDSINNSLYKKSLFCVISLYKLECFKNFVRSNFDLNVSTIDILLNHNDDNDVKDFNKDIHRILYDRLSSLNYDLEFDDFKYLVINLNGYKYKFFSKEFRPDTLITKFYDSYSNLLSKRIVIQSITLVTIISAILVMILGDSSINIKYCRMFAIVNIPLILYLVKDYFDPIDYFIGDPEPSSPNRISLILLSYLVFPIILYFGLTYNCSSILWIRLSEDLLRLIRTILYLVSIIMLCGSVILSFGLLSDAYIRSRRVGSCY